MSSAGVRRVLTGAFLSVAGSAWALTALPMKPEAIVPEADLIVVGTVTESSPGVAVVDVDETLKGRCGKRICIGQVHEWRAPGLALPRASRLFCLQRRGETYQPVGSDRFLEGIRDPGEKGVFRGLVAAEAWGEAGADGLRLSCGTTAGAAVETGKSCWLRLQVWNTGAKALVIRADPAGCRFGSVLAVTDPDGKTREIQAKASSAGPPEWRLEPGEVLGWTVDPNDPCFVFEKPGRHRIVWKVAGAVSNAVELDVPVASPKPPKPDPAELERRAREAQERAIRERINP